MSAIEKELAVFEHDNDRECKQQKGLNALAIGVGREDFIEISCRDMEYDCHENVTVGFVIKPVHQNDKWKNADDEVQTV